MDNRTRQNSLTQLKLNQDSSKHIKVIPHIDSDGFTRNSSINKLHTTTNKQPQPILMNRRVTKFKAAPPKPFKLSLENKKNFINTGESGAGSPRFKNENDVYIDEDSAEEDYRDISDVKKLPE